jgi:hypothetical protein
MTLIRRLCPCGRGFLASRERAQPLCPACLAAAYRALAGMVLAGEATLVTGARP